MQQWGPTGYGYGYRPPSRPTSPLLYAAVVIAIGVFGFIVLMAVIGAAHRGNTRMTATASASARPMTAIQAAQEWPTTQERMTTLFADVDRLLAKDAFLDADDVLVAGQKEIERFADTPTASEKSYLDIAKRLADTRKRIASSVAPQRAAHEKEQAADDADDATRGPEPKHSGWDGSVTAVKRYLRPRMNDPETLSFEGCTKPIVAGVYWVTTCSYRGTNKLGAKVLNSGRFFIQRDEVVKVED